MERDGWNGVVSSVVWVVVSDKGSCEVSVGSCEASVGSTSLVGFLSMLDF